MSAKKIFLFILIICLSLSVSQGFARTHHIRSKVNPSHRKKQIHHHQLSKPKYVPSIIKGTASWYGPGFHNRTTASGERYNMYRLTAAHKTLPLSTYVQVTNLKNGKQVIVKINDRGPYIRNRTIDLSFAAAKKLDMVSRGLAPVKIRIL